LQGSSSCITLIARLGKLCQEGQKQGELPWGALPPTASAPLPYCLLGSWLSKAEHKQSTLRQPQQQRGAFEAVRAAGSARRRLAGHRQELAPCLPSCRAKAAASSLSSMGSLAP